MLDESSPKNPLPERPRLVLRVGFAGNRELPDDGTAPVREVLAYVFETITRQLIEIAPGQPLQPDHAPSIAQFYSTQIPLLRLITGLAEGADSLAAQALDQVAAESSLKSEFDAELAAVLPFDLATYRTSRTEAFRAEFDREAARCAYILSLDGIFDKPDPDTQQAKDRRARAYRGQSTLLLRQADLLVVAADLGEHGRAGGAMETAHAALEFDLPVVFVNTRDRKIRLIAPGKDLISVLADKPLENEQWPPMLRGWVRSIVCGTTAELSGQLAPTDPPPRGKLLLEEFFRNANAPPLHTGRDGKVTRKPTSREQLWSKLERRFRPAGAGDLKSDPPLAPYASWRGRATGLSRHYSGLYRGAFLLNYALAVAAVILATFSLALVAMAYASATPASPAADAGRERVVVNTVRGAAAAENHEDLLEPPWWLLPALLVSGAGKLWILGLILRNTDEANHGDWNDKAVDYRYLAERLRTMYYLPRIGSFQPPAAAEHHYVARTVRQSSVDWLFDAIVRSISPAELLMARVQVITSPAGETLGTPQVIDLNPRELLESVRDDWVDQQAEYHHQTARTMARLFKLSENVAGFLSRAVLVIVLADVILIVIELFDVIPDEWSHVVRVATPWLLLLAAVLPAAVASINATRFQSECRRLAERSTIMRAILRGRDQKGWLKGGRWAEADWLSDRIERAQSDPASDPGAWSVDALRLAETIATDFVHEVSEWSVLYAREVPEP
jgi:hypothetical protein